MDRKEFAKRLHSVVIPKGTSPEELKKRVLPVSEAIINMMPGSLFRYRDCTDLQIDAFKNDTIYLVTADKFNDPYDTLVRYDQKEIERVVNTIMSCEAFEELKIWFSKGNKLPDEVMQILPDGTIDFLKNALLAIDDINALKDKVEENRQRMINLIETFFPILSEMSKRNSTMACLSENIKSVLMWSHYANSHQGFALEYIFRPTLEKPIFNVGLFPVIYDEERMDVSQYMAWTFLQLIGIAANEPDITSYLKIILHKSSLWSYEQEWRLIDSSPRNITDDSPSVIHFKPVAIYYGLHMEENKKAQLHEIALEKQIKEYQMYIDYASSKYEMLFRRVQF